jgi:hypothetical protein
MSKFLAAIINPLLALLAAWLGGKKAAQVEELKSYVETSKKIDAVKPDADAALEWLRDRAKR